VSALFAERPGRHSQTEFGNERQIIQHLAFNLHSTPFQ
jgi:hypothetical protein